jgi:hypothetical protein
MADGQKGAGCHRSSHDHFNRTNFRGYGVLGGCDVYVSARIDVTGCRGPAAKSKLSGERRLVMRFATLSITRRILPLSAAIAVAAILALTSIARAGDSEECSAKTIRGVYLFHATGFNIVNGAALPKAIIEKLVFDGEGNVSTPAVSLSVNGTIVQPPQGAPGTYTVDADCTGTLTFLDAAGNRFDLQIKPNGNEFNMLQTNPNTVLQGTAERVARLRQEHE